LFFSTAFLPKWRNLCVTKRHQAIDFKPFCQTTKWSHIGLRFMPPLSLRENYSPKDLFCPCAAPSRFEQDSTFGRRTNDSTQGRDAGRGHGRDRKGHEQDQILPSTEIVRHFINKSGNPFLSGVQRDKPPTPMNMLCKPQP
jgi:hypothetical protein